MKTLDMLAKNAHLTLVDLSQEPANCGATRFRWGIHIALPFTLPTSACLHERVSVDGRSYDFSIHNFLDRLTTFPATPSTWPVVGLIARSVPTPSPETGWRIARETLQSVAAFVEVSEHPSAGDAVVGAAEKVKTCFQWLTGKLAELQKAMPYLSAWQVYPISQFEVGLVYHSVEHFCPNTGRWDHYRTGITINLARQLHQPLCQIDLIRSAPVPPSVDLSDELLAEAQVAYFRGLYRSTVLNSYQAVESLANAVFVKKHEAKLVADGFLPAAASAQAEALRKGNRVKIKFLVHEGLEPACGSSLYRADKEQYDALCALKELRNQIAHANRKPTQSEASEAHTLCCEVVRWLCGVGGHPVRPLVAEAAATAPGLLSLPADVNAIPGAATAFLRWILGIAPDNGLIEVPCQFGLQVQTNTPAESNRARVAPPVPGRQ
jgi:hypothetical protein